MSVIPTRLVTLTCDLKKKLGLEMTLVPSVCSSLIFRHWKQAYRRVAYRHGGRKFKEQVSSG